MSRGGPRFGSLLPEVRVPPPGPASRALTGRLRAVESRNITHVGDHWPIFWEEAAGSNVRDADGNVYIDLTAAFGVALLGHASPAVRFAIAEQSQRLIHGMGDIHPPTKKLELLERLDRISPWDDTRTVLATTGSEAVEIALKTARLASGRPGILAFEGGYHGLTLGSLAATARAHFRGPFTGRSLKVFLSLAATAVAPNVSNTSSASSRDASSPCISAKPRSYGIPFSSHIAAASAVLPSMTSR